MLDIILIILGVLCLITGLMGCVLPFLAVKSVELKQENSNGK